VLAAISRFTSSAGISVRPAIFTIRSFPSLLKSKLYWKNLFNKLNDLRQSSPGTICLFAKSREGLKNP
jgi:hypothetical protein